MGNHQSFLFTLDLDLDLDLDLRFIYHLPFVYYQQHGFHLSHQEELN